MLGLKFYTTTATQVLKRVTFGACHAVRASSSNAAAIETAQSGSEAIDKEPKVASSQNAENVKKQKHTLVAAAFENLKDKSDQTNIDERITNAKTINGLLSVTESSPLTRQHALRIVSILSEWSTEKRVKLSEFENDSRFLKLCHLLGRTANNRVDKETGPKRMSGYGTDDLNTVLGVAGDDEAAKLIASISLPQMVKVMSTLAARKRRSTPLLRSLAFNISSATDHLDLKQCADVFFAMATLNFQDSVLSAKVCADILAALPKNTEKSAVVGSILTSLGIMKYRDLDILEAITQWIINHRNICRPQDLSALFLTSAILNFKTTSMEDVRQKIVTTVLQEDFNKSIDWLNHIWALTMLGISSNEHWNSVLDQNFIEKLNTGNGLTATSKMKLLNIDSYVRLMVQDYKGHVIAKDSVVHELPMAHSKSKQVLINGLMDALKSLLPANNHVRSLVDSKMGFLIDAICVFDAKLKPLPLDKEHTNSIKVALMMVDYHDICHGTHRSSSGITSLSFDLLEKSGYKVIPVPYNEFNTSDKLLKRVQYLESKFKSLVSPKA